jgi:hypothetical protein
MALTTKPKDFPTAPIPPHRILRDVYRHYMEYRDLVAAGGNHVIEHSYFIYDVDADCEDCEWTCPGDGASKGEKHAEEEKHNVIYDVEIKGKESVTISFWDLYYGLKDLSKRKREAVFWNVILDKKQKDVAKIMVITTVSVGQYVELAMQQLSKRYFAELSHDDSGHHTRDRVPA